LDEEDGPFRVLKRALRIVGQSLRGVMLGLGAAVSPR
jgi:hypothetical protein